MCGIAGLVQRYPNPALRQMFVKAAQDLLQARGPDDQTAAFYGDHVTLVHTRLAIIDPAGGQQPVQDARGAIVFNGEIYNYRELRQPDETYATHSDTEVLLKGLNRGGVGFLDETDGMFGLGHYDFARQLLTLARDRFGIKSVYYYCDDEVFAFASTLAPLMPFSRKEIDTDALHEYYLFRAARAPRTLFRDIRELEPGTSLTFDIRNFRLSAPHRWTAPLAANRTITAEGEALEVLDQAMQLSLRRHLVSDVPVATFLSGGVDSSLITAMAAQHAPGLSAFTVGFSDDRFDESGFAAQLCRRHHLRHHVLYTGAETFLDLLEGWPRIMDDVVADPSAVLFHRVAQFARESGYKVLLSGEGADELFAGYNQQFRFKLAERLQPWGRLLGWAPEVLRRVKPEKTRLIQYARQLTAHPHFHGSSMIFEPYLAGSLFADPVAPFETADTLSEALVHDQRLRLANDILTRTDRATMGASIEARVPFLTAYVAAAANGVSADLLIQGRLQKSLLKKYAERYVPKACLYRPKVGFDLPLARWLRGPLKPMVMDQLQGSWQMEYFRPGQMETVVTSHMQGRSSHADKIFAFILLEKSVKYLRSLH